MKFYNRNLEMQELDSLFEQSSDCAKMIIISGRRRIGKTALALEFAQKHKYIYLFVSKKSEQLLCKEYLEEIQRHFQIPVIGEIKLFKEIFALLLELSRNNSFVLIVDEFQEFYNINNSIYSDIQHLWDINKNGAKINCIFIGSIYSLMNKIFIDSKEPLYGRADRQILLKPFEINTIKEILYDYGATDLKTLFDTYVITGGMPKYIDLLMTNKAVSFKEMLNFIFRANSPFIYEGKNLLIEEFGKEYGIYFSILELISYGKTSRPEIESILESNIGGHLERLEKDYSIITKYKPINAKPRSHLLKYQITDNFINFWFRFVYKNISALETGNFNYMIANVQRDYSTYSGIILEKFFKELFAYSQNYNKIGSYWEKGNTNQIDIVAINDMKKEIIFAEIKLNKARININILKEKSRKLLGEYLGYTPKWLGLSLEDADGHVLQGTALN